MGVDLSGQVVLRWDSASNCAPLLEAGGVDAVWLLAPGQGVAAACRSAGAQVLPAEAVRLVRLAEAGAAQPGEMVAVKEGNWPGAQASQHGGDSGWVAGATRRPWVEANGYLPGYLRALYPAVPPVLGYLPTRDAGVDPQRVVPFDSLELALVDAWAGGGNYILAPDRAYSDALLASDQRALAAWKQLGKTARWLKEHRSLFRQPPPTSITMLVEPGENTAELAKLLYRQSAAADFVSSTRVPAPDPTRRPVIVAAGIRPPAAEIRKILLAHAAAGATLVTDAGGDQAWWRTAGLKPDRQFEDREFYRLGSGRLVAYKEAIVDPGEFALDVIDLAGNARPARLWDSPAAIATVSQAGPRAKPVLCVVNYGFPRRMEFLARVCGSFDSATLLRPEAEPTTLRTYRRGGGTEVGLPALGRIAVVVFG